jgi:hypothetical protein
MKTIKSTSLRKAGHSARIGLMVNEDKILVGIPEGKRLFSRRRLR